MLKHGITISRRRRSEILVAVVADVPAFLNRLVEVPAMITAAVLMSGIHDGVPALLNGVPANATCALWKVRR